MEDIIKIFTGRHIDLSKIVSITDAYFIDRMGSGGYFVGFDIECQLLDKPIKYERRFEYHEYTHKEKTMVAMVDGTYMEAFHFIHGQREDRILAVHNLQKQVDGIILNWKLFKSEQSN